MRANWKAAGALVLLPWLGGCGTVGNFTGKEPCRVFGGTRIDAELMSEGFGSDPKVAKTEQLEGPILFSEGCHGLVDMPLSLVADTITLPITACVAMKRSADSPPPAEPAPSDAH